MKFKSGDITFKQWSLFALFMFSVATVAYYSPPGIFRRIDFELTGTVLDNETKQPIEGAYVVAIYEETAAGFAKVSSYCVKTKGMTTGKDGKFHFPVEKLDNRSPRHVIAIKSGYFFADSKYPKGYVQERQELEAYSDRDIYLAKQDPAKPSFQYGALEVFCDYPRMQADAAAAIEFLKILQVEFDRLGANSQQKIGLDDWIKRLEQLPDKADSRN